MLRPLQNFFLNIPFYKVLNIVIGRAFRISHLGDSSMFGVFIKYPLKDKNRDSYDCYNSKGSTVTKSCYDRNCSFLS